MTAASPNRETGQLLANSPYLIANITALMSLIFTVITSAIMAVSIIRDFEHNTETMLFTTRLKKRDYLMGRFAGSFAVLIIINCAGWLGLMAGFSFGTWLPWDVAWIDEGILPFRAWHFFQPFLIFTVPNLFAIGALFFLSGALGRSSIIIYTQGIVLLVLYQIGIVLIRNVDSQSWGAMLDPFGIQTLEYVTRYWAPPERNSTTVLFEGILLYNRLLWMGIGVVSLVITYFGFSYHKVRRRFGTKKLRPTVETDSEIKGVIMPVVNQANGTWMLIQQIIRSAMLQVRMIRKEIPFLALIITGVLLIVFNAIKMTDLNGSSSYPTVFSVLRVLGSFNLVLVIIAFFYSGELVWRERTVGFAPIADAMPVPSFVDLLSKFLALLFIDVILLFLLVVCGVIIQAAYGYFVFDVSAYFVTLFLGTLTNLVLFTLLSFFIQVMVNDKFLGFTLCIVFFVVNSILNQMGAEHDLWQFASGSLGIFSDMNLYGHFITPFAWFKLYWFGCSGILFAIAIVFSVRGTETLLRLRWQAGSHSITRPLVIFTLTSASTFIFSGIYIYYNTTVLNVFETSQGIEERQAKYEKTFKRYQFMPQPKIVESNIRMDIYPSNRDFTAEGFYYLKNKSDQNLKEIHVQQNADRQLKLNYLTFDKPARLLEDYPEFRYAIYRLVEPLEPGDSIRMSFQLSFTTPGFEESRSNTDIVYNGTFLNNSYFPSLGYNDAFELNDNGNRRKQGLKIKDRMLDHNDPRGKSISVFGDDADHIRFEMVLSTEIGQIAIAPGYLQKEWQQNGRKYFHYKNLSPMSNFYSIVSARYGVVRDTWNGVTLEIYHHPGHEFNLERMMKAMKNSLDYCSKNFGPFQYRQLRIMEFPRYMEFAQSYAGIIPFSEGIGFIYKVNDRTKDVDMAYCITAHEVAHQWWGHQVMEAGVKGSGMLSESMAQYSALMTMKRELPQEVVGQFLKYELDRYLAGRAAEQRKEQPLQFVEGQNYIQYNKASIVFYALQDYIGEDNVNAAFRKYNQEWAFKGPPFPTSTDLVKHLRQVTPDSLQYLFEDMFETITLFENKAVEATYEEVQDGFEVTLKISSNKIRADSVGNETFIKPRDWIDVGIYASDGDRDRLIYLKKHLITRKENTITIFVKEKPVRAGIDPLHKLIDKHSSDNMITTTQLVELTNLPISPN
jgi:hypothetical protein